ADSVTCEKFGSKGPLHVGGHRLEALFADLREEPAFVDHTAQLAAHADGTGLTSVFGTHSAPESREADLAGQSHRIRDRLPAAAAFERFHRLRSCERRRELSHSVPADPNTLRADASRKGANWHPFKDRRSSRQFHAVEAVNSMPQQLEVRRGSSCIRRIAGRAWHTPRPSTRPNFARADAEARLHDRAARDAR